MEADQLRTAATGNDPRLITAIFDDLGSAERAYNGLRLKGYRPEEITLIMSQETHTKHFSDNDHVIIRETGTATAVQDAAIGSAIGGTVGALLGAIAAIGTSLVIPGLGLIIAGPIAAGLAGAGAGTITGGILGALAGAGVPESHVEIYEAGIKQGHIVIGFHPRSDEDADYFENENWNKVAA
jgi:hypothetical protein